MEPQVPHDELMLKKARRIGIVFLAYVLGLPLFTIALESQFEPGTGPFVLSWVMLLLMPIEILLVYVVYRFFSSRYRSQSIMGPAILMYILATAPSIYAFVIGFIDSALRYIAVPLGLMFSIVGFWLALIFISRLWDVSKDFNQ